MGMEASTIIYVQKADMKKQTKSNTTRDDWTTSQRN